MAEIKGFNPRYWNCEQWGCELKQRPKVELFAKNFPRAIGFTDIDYWVELAGSFFVLEWKGPYGELKDGQRWALERFTKMRKGNVAFVVHGKAETMEITEIRIIWDGAVRWQVLPPSLDALNDLMQRWAIYIESEAARRRTTAGRAVEGATVGPDIAQFRSERREG